MEWGDFFDELATNANNIHLINNNSSQNIILFGSCHLSTIGYMLNELFQHKYNIYIIISWYYKNTGYTQFDMVSIKENIKTIVSKSHIFIYMKHYSDYGIDANNIEKYVSNKALKLRVPNLKLVYNKNEEEYLNSLKIIKYSIEDSDFKEFDFIVKQHKEYIFFNTIDHPTHYILYLLTKSIQQKIIGEHFFTGDNGMSEYLNLTNKKEYTDMKNKFVILPGNDDINYEITGILKNAVYFD